MPLTVKFRDIEKDILEAVRCGQYVDSSNSETGDSDEGDEDKDGSDDGDSESMAMPQHQVPNHGKGIPLRPLAPDSGADLLSPALLDMLSDTPHAGGIETNSRGNGMSLAASTDSDQEFVHDSDDLENAFADW
jgi:hypothetical protein